MRDCFQVDIITEEIITFIREWFDKNGKDCNAVVGISGGKDSTVVAALCAKALGKDRVIGVMMPNRIQDDIDDSKKVCEVLGIKQFTVDIGDAYDGLIKSVIKGTSLDKLSDQTLINAAPRIRMATLYAVSQSMNGRVINTCNLSETLLSWETRWGDAVGDVAPIVRLTVEEVKAIGHYLKLPKELVDKIPSDGLCGASDEEKMGIKYKDADNYIRRNIVDDDIKAKIDERVNAYEFKRNPIPYYDPELPMYVGKKD